MFKKCCCALLLAFVATLPACTTVKASAVVSPSASAVAERMELVREIKEYEKRIGWGPTENFLRYEHALVSYSFCVYTGEFDFNRVVTWDDEGGCPEKERHDRSSAVVEAVAGSGTPLSRSLVEADIARFVYVIFHEDFHEQIANIPTLALNESATQLVGLYAAEGFLREKYGADSAIHRIFVGAIDEMLLSARIEREYHGKLTELYDRIARGEVGRAEGLREKALLYETMRRICREAGQSGLYTSCREHKNNADLDTALLYSAFYERFHELHVCLGGDARKTSLMLMQLVGESLTEEDEFISRMHALMEQGCR